MSLTTRPWDAADHVGSDEAAAAYLDAALEDGDPRLVAAALGDIARAKGITDLDARTGLSRTELDLSLSASGDPGLSTIMKVVAALGLRLSARHEVSDAA